MEVLFKNTQHSTIIIKIIIIINIHCFINFDNFILTETLALKGLFLCNLGRKEEGYAEVKHGIKNNIKSYICK